ncbi:phosphoenolpyruvate--protein phosphotransferase [Actinoplanes sp. NPDC051343]|uniref:phosphoenolpyruvate--protein phosphotransferase n=1 Tax=Actinoplanes sp. NPDC051343 TaxID=3363906 RepID=UPI00379D9C5E
MVGLVVVGHSRALATAAVALAAEMVHDRPVPIEVAAGLDDTTFGTDATAIMDAITSADRGDGVVVLMDLGSALLSTELALELLEDGVREKVTLSAAPLVEGLVAAAVSAAAGATRQEVAAEAANALAGKQAQLGAEVTLAAGTPSDPPIAVSDGTASFVLRNAHGLHARPAARLVAEARRFDASVELRNATTRSAWVPAGSLSRVATLGALEGHVVEVRASGRQAHEATDAVLALAGRAFGEDSHDLPAPAGDVLAAGILPGQPASARDRPAPLPPPPQHWVGSSKAGGSDNSSGSSTIGASSHTAKATSTTAEATSPKPADIPSTVMNGQAASPGIAIGPVWHLQGGTPQIPDTPPQDAATEQHRLNDALASVRADIEAVKSVTTQEIGPAEAEIFDAHLLLLDDADILDEAHRRIRDGETAPRAWATATERTAAAFQALDDPYLQARAADVHAVGDQVLRALLGITAAPLNREGILVAPELTPAEAAALDPATVTGVLLAYGSPTSHGAILARTRGTPAVVGLGPAVLEVPDGAFVVFDGGTGEVVIEPGADRRAAFRERAAAQEQRRKHAFDRSEGPAVSRDGVTVSVGANVGSVADAAAAAAYGADMAGLVRTEFLFLDRDAAPDADEQEATYRAIAAALGGRRITLRTLDVGGDKPLRYLPGPAEENPFLGVRGLRHSLAHPDLLAIQLQAMVRVARDHPVDIMFPMVSTVDEVIAARRVLGQVPETLRVGIMIEVPAAALKAAAFAPYVDFVSIGTNDLTQYTLAAERGNPALASLADGLDPGVLRLIDTVCRAARGHFEVAVCGELAADPAAVEILTGLGVHELSMAPPAIPAVKELVRGLDLKEAAARAATALTLPSAAAVRAPH